MNGEWTGFPDHTDYTRKMPGKIRGPSDSQALTWIKLGQEVVALRACGKVWITRSTCAESGC